MSSSCKIVLLVCYVVVLQQIESDDSMKVERAEGFRVERIGSGGIRVNFSWVRTDTINSWIQAAQYCSQLNGNLARASEMRYFYKTLRSDDAQLPSLTIQPVENRDDKLTYGVTFYLADVLEATMDYPNTESGERMCLVVEKQPQSPVHLAEVTTVRSCTTPVNLVVCRSPVDSSDMSDSNTVSGYAPSPTAPCNPYADQWSGPQPQWIVELKNKAAFKDEHVCFKPEIFYTTVALTGVALLLTTMSSIGLAIKQYRSVHKSKRIQMRNGEEHLLASGTAIAGNTSELSSLPGNLDTTGGGRLDILADSAFYRGPGINSTRESYKQAIISDGYQKLANGLQAGARLSRNNANPVSYNVRTNPLWSKPTESGRRAQR
ncbi:hypothetical protein EG68_06520 [Paragonimus skrjabini miyazakii]|uniref:Uncharacterized protein n=1 Tax=Paragonimus skrjabini miyazakii TaxID=59628 RepID=A0A8S9Z071_9TREM|nr:hypothetical protein EG68_06520 [Paragonimus skrjabini miyazakii]